MSVEVALHPYYIGEMTRDERKYFFYENIPPSVIKDWDISPENYPKFKIWRDKNKRNYNIRRELEV